MKRKLITGCAAIAMVAVFGTASPAAAAKTGFPGRSYCSGATGPDGIVDPDDFTTWNNPGEVISFVAPNQAPGGGPDSIGAVALFCNPNANPLPG